MPELVSDKPANSSLLPDQILFRIHLIPGLKVMLDNDLASIYGVATKALKQQVRRNTDRFPADFMFELTDKDLENLRSQIVTSSHGGNRYASMAFTEHGILMLSSVLRSTRAIEMNIHIMRVFVRMRQMLDDHSIVVQQIEEIQRRISDHDDKLQAIFQVLQAFSARTTENENRNLVGFNRSH